LFGGLFLGLLGCFWGGWEGFGANVRELFVPGGASERVTDLTDWGLVEV